MFFCCGFVEEGEGNNKVYRGQGRQKGAALGASAIDAAKLCFI